MDIADAIPHHTGVGRWLRAPLRAVPAGRVVRILRGPARGMRWITGSGPHGVWLGLNETRKRRLLAERAAGRLFYDVGAHVGSFVLSGHRAARIVAFEPLPRNLEFLRRHVELNGLDHVTIVDSAVADRSGRAAFDAEPTGLLGRLDAAGAARVNVTTLDVFSGSPGCIKIDVEGAEAAVLRGAEALLAECRPVLFVALHGAQPGVYEILRRHGYQVRELGPGEIMAEWRPQRRRAPA